MLIGNDVKLNSPSSLIGQALADILQYPDRARDALRVLLHLVRLMKWHNWKALHLKKKSTDTTFVVGGEIPSENTERPAQFHVHFTAKCGEQGGRRPWLAGSADSCGVPSRFGGAWNPCCCFLSYCWPRGQAPAVQHHFAIITRYGVRHAHSQQTVSIGLFGFDVMDWSWLVGLTVWSWSWLMLDLFLRSPTTSSPGLVQTHHSFRSRRAANQPGRPLHLKNSCWICDKIAWKNRISVLKWANVTYLSQLWICLLWRNILHKDHIKHSVTIEHFNQEQKRTPPTLALWNYKHVCLQTQ